MDRMSTERDKQLLSIANASGFPFQLRVEDLVKTTASRHGWKVLVREHPWADPETGQAGFIDLVLANDPVRLVVECKRSQEGQWVFLLPAAEKASIERARSFTTVNQKNGVKTFEWAECGFKPPSAESSLCAVRGTGEGDRPLLERLAAQVSRATESFGTQEITCERSPSHDIGTIYVPVIVSNAELVMCNTDPAQIDIATGTITRQDATFTTASLIRFRKPLTSRVAPSRFSDVSSVNRDAERTVFVINAAALPDCLRDLRFYDILPDHPRWR